MAVLLPLAMVVAVLNVSGTRRGDGEPNDCPRARDFWIVATFFVFSYAIWLKKFGVQRYILTLELLTGVVLLLCLDRVLRSARAVWVVLGLLVMVSLLWTRAPDWGRIPYGVNWFGLAPGGENVSPTLYVRGCNVSAWIRNRTPVDLFRHVRTRSGLAPP